MEFSNDEIKDMKAFYERELASTLDRLKHIERVLDKIGGTKVNIDVSVGDQPKQKAETPKPRKTSTRRRGKKRGPKSVWGNFVLNKLKDADKPMTYDELVDAAMEFSKLPKEKEKNVRQSIINVTFKLRTKDGAIDTFSKGSRIKHIALKSWFDESGQIKDEYAEKVKVIKPKPTRKRKAIRKKTSAVKTAPAKRPKQLQSAAKGKATPKSAPKKKSATTKKTSTRKKPTASKNPTRAASASKES